MALFLLALFKGAPLSTRAFVASRLPFEAEKSSGLESLAFFKSADIPLFSKILIISTLPKTAAW